MRTPKLIKIDLGKAVKHECPGINTRSVYLCRIGGEYFAGRFSRQWYGLNFDGWVGDAGLQFDAPGTNSSDWEAVWRIKG